MLKPACSSVLSPIPFGETSSRSHAWLRSTMVAVAATALIALCAHISVPVPFTPIPVTMQTFAVLLLGMLLGPVLGAATMLLYLMEGAAGLPVFSPHGLGGLAQLTGPSGGYLLCYPVAALLAGFTFSVLKRVLPIYVAAAASAVLADTALLGAGSAWLGNFLHLAPVHALQIGAFPFIGGEILKLVLVSIALSAFSKTKRTPSR